MHSFSEQSYWWNLSWKTCANSSAFWVLPPANEAIPSPNICKPLEKSWAHSFSGQSHWWNLSWKPVPTALLLSTALPPNGALPQLFPKVSLPSTLSSLPYRSFPPELSPSYFPRFPFRPPCRHSRIAPSHRSSPQAISHGLPPVHPLVTPVSLLPTGALPSYFPRVPPPPLSRRFHIAPSHRSSPQAISHCFPAVHHLFASVSLLPHRALPKLFPTVSPPCTLLSLPSRSFPMHGALPKLFPTVSPPSTLSSLPYRSFPTKKCTPLWREAHFEVKMYKAHHVRTIFGGSDVVSRGRRKGLWTLSKLTKTWGFCRRKFRSQTSDNMDRWKAEQGRGREKRKIRRKKSRRERVRRKKMQMREKVGKSRNSVFFQWFVAPEGRKVGSPKRRVRSQLARWEMKNCTPLWREAHLQVKMYKTPQRRSTFGSCDVEKVHAVVVRSTFPSQNVQSTPRSDHFWKLRCRKSARHCGAKHISKWTCTKHTSSGPLLEVKMSKKCTPLWREAHFQVKMVKTLGVRTTFGGSDVASLRFTTIHYVTLHYTTLHYNTLHYTPQHYKYNNATTLHYTKFHYTTLHSTTLHYTTLHYLPLHLTTLHYIKLHYTTLHYTTTTQLHSTTLH